MKTKLTGLALLANLLAPSSTSALISSDGDKIYSPKTLFYDSCNYHGYTLRFKCDTLNYYNHSGKPVCNLIETRNKFQKIVRFPKHLAHPVARVEIYPLQRIYYCFDPKKQKTKDDSKKSQLICVNYKF